MFTNNKEKQEELTEKYVTPYVNGWEALNITPSKNYYDWRLEDGSGRLTDILKCNKCNNKWKDLLSEYKQCPYCTGTSIKRNFKYGTKVQVTNPFDNKKLSKDESVIYNYLTKVCNFLPSEDKSVNNRFIPNYRENGSMERDFYLPYYDITIECQGEQHFYPIDIDDCPQKTDSDRRLMFFSQIIRDVEKFNILCNKRILYYINTDNLLCDEIDFEKKSIESILNEIKTEIECNKDSMEKILQSEKDKGRFKCINTIDESFEYIKQSIEDMYLTKNRAFKDPEQLITILLRIVNKNNSLS